MRQIGDDYRRDPFKPMTTGVISPPEALSAAQEAELSQYQRNQFLKFAYDNCGAQFEKNNRSLSAEDKATFNNCIAKFQSSVSIFNQEKDIFNMRIQEIQKSGGDIFGNLNQY